MDKKSKKLISPLNIAKATALVSKAVGKSEETEKIIAEAMSLFGSCLNFDLSHFWVWDPDSKKLFLTNSWAKSPRENYLSLESFNSFKLGEGLPGEVGNTKKLLWLENLQQAKNFPRRDAMTALGMKSGLATPIELENELYGVLEFFCSEIIEYDEILALNLQSIAFQLGHLFERSFNLKNLQRTTAFSRAMMDASLDSIISMDEKGRIIDWNKGAEKLFGHSHKEALEKDLAELIIPERYRRPHREGLDRYLKTGEGPVLGKRIELPALRKDGSEFLSEIAITVVDLKGPPRFTAFLRDISRQKEVENKLLSSESLFRGLFEENPLSVQVLDSKGGTTQVNAAWRKLWNVSEEEAREKVLEGKYNVFKDQQLIDKGIIPYFKKAFAGEMAKAPPISYDSKEVGATGRARWVEAYFNPIKDITGKVSHVIIVHDDITEKVNIQKEIESGREKFRGVFFQAPLAMSYSDENMNFLMLNQAYCDFFGRSEEEILNLSFKDLTHPDEDLTRDKENLRKLINGKIPSFRYEKRYLHKSGKTLWGIANATLLRNPVTGEKNVLAAIQDITERKVIEAQKERNLEIQTFLGQASYLLSSSLDYRQTLQKVTDLAIEKLCDWAAVDLVEPDGAIENSAVSHPDEALKQTAIKMREKFPINPREEQGVAQVLKTGKPLLYPEVSTEALKAAARNEEHYNFMKTLSLKSALLVPVTARKKILGVLTLISTQEDKRFSEDNVLDAMELGRRAGMAVDNARLYDQAQEAIKARDSFLSIASHELKTPVSSILLQLEMINLLLKESDVSFEELKKKVENISSSSLKQLARLVDLIEDLLDVSRIQAHKLSFQAERFKLKKITQEIFTRHANQVQKVGSSYNISIDPEIEVDWDPFRYEQIIVNLISNALKYAPASPIEVEAFQKDEWITLHFQDHGPGIAEEKLGQIFQRFERATSSRSISGLGLGLFIVKTMTEAHQGRVDVKSSVGEGAKFTLKIPAHPAME